MNWDSSDGHLSNPLLTLPNILYHLVLERRMPSERCWRSFHIDWCYPGPVYPAGNRFEIVLVLSRTE